jgi:protein NrfD
MTAISTRALPRAEKLPGAWPERLTWLVAVVLAAAGVVGVVWRFTGGHAAADYGSYVPWGLWIAAYVALVGASAGAFAFAALLLVQRRREHYRLAILAMLVALAAFAAGMINVWLDLGHPFRAWRLMANTQFGSVMGLMAWFYALYAAVLLLGLWATRKGEVPAFMERFAWVGFLFAMVFAGSEGALFGVVGAQPMWESGLTPVLFLVEAGLFGLALVAAAGALFGLLTTGTARRLGYGLLGFLGALLVLEWSEYSTALRAAVPQKAHAAEAILTGEYWWVFWIVHLGLGVAVPGVLLLVGRGRIPFVGTAAGLVIAMGLASKLNLIVPALTHEHIEGLAEAFTGPGLVYSYFPTAMEWLVAVGTVGVAALIVLIGRHVLAPTLGPPTDRHPQMQESE